MGTAASHARPSAARAWLGLLVLLATALVALAVAPAANATGTLDQSQTTPGFGGYSFSGSSKVIGQTFTAGLSGRLDQVDLDVRASATCPDSGVSVQIRSVVGGAPSGTVLASATAAQDTVVNASGFVSVVFTAAATVSAGTQYAIVVSAPDALGNDCMGAFSDSYVWDSTEPDPYARGEALVSGDGGVSWTAEAGGTIDQRFRTYVVPPDATAPRTTITLNPASPSGSGGWYTSPVAVSVSASDPDDSVAQTRCVLDPASVPASYDSLPAGPCSLASVSSGGRHTIYAASVDSNGNKETPGASSSFMIDTTAPSDAPVITPASANGTNGWYTSNVTVSWNWSDSGSGIDTSNCTQTSTTGSDGSAVTLSSTCKDLAGNTTTDSRPFKIDTTAPSLAPTVSPSPLYLNQSGASAAPNASDGALGSGVASSSCGTIDTSSAGDHTVTCSAADNAGNSNSATIHYTVQYKILAFFSPASGSKWKLGQTVPIKIALADASGMRIPDTQAAGAASACRVTFSAQGAQTKTAQCMKYDASNHQFHFNWMIVKTGSGAETITVTVSYPNISTTTTKSESIRITS